MAINDWLEERGKDRLIAERAAHVLEQRRGLSRTDMRKILRSVFPVPDQTISFTLARHAAQFLRIRRNGGWIISPAPDGMWWVGARKRTAAELLALAEVAGFEASLSDDGDTKVE